MKGAAAAGVDAQAHILEHGYVVLEGLIGADEVARLRASLDVLMARERTEPFDPGAAPAYAGEDEHVASLAQSRCKSAMTSRGRSASTRSAAASATSRRSTTTTTRSASST